MQWEEIETNLNDKTAEFLRIAKCLSKSKLPKQETVAGHVENLKKLYEEIRQLTATFYNNLTTDHKQVVVKRFYKIRDKLVTIFDNLNIKTRIPYNFNSSLDETITDSDTDEEETDIDDKMPLTAMEFMNFASRILPEFDGKPENLQRFIDAIELINTQKDTHNDIAIHLIKTKLVGATRNIIGQENTIADIINVLKTKVKGESTEVLTAKMMSLKQNGKQANQFTKEIEELTRALTNAYITEGVPLSLSENYATRTAVKALATNATNQEVKLIMKAGQFGNLNEAISKFVNSSTESTLGANVMYFSSQSRGNYRRGGRGRGYYGYNSARANNYNNNEFHNENRNRGRPNTRGNNRGYYRGGNSNGNVRYVAQDQGNLEEPQPPTLGEI